MCYMSHCEAEATHYVVIAHPSGDKRLELCRKHLELGHQLHDASMTNIKEYGRLDAAWTVHPGGVHGV